MHKRKAQRHLLANGSYHRSLAIKDLPDATCFT
jgi:hypothetical protein